MSDPTPAPELSTPAPRPYDAEAEARARAALDAMPKPLGSLGSLEKVLAWWCGSSGQFPPVAPVRPRLVVFAGDHGVAAQGVSVQPADGTVAAVRRTLAGEGALPAFARHYRVPMQIVDVGVAGDLGDAASSAHAAFVARRVRSGTADFTVEPALTREDAAAAVAIGVELARAAAAEGVDVLAAGAWGVGGSTSAAALLGAIAAVPGKLAAGRGSGVDDAGLARKVRAIDAGLTLHRPGRRDAIGALSAVGGLEIAAIAGLCIGGAASGVPVVLDGFASTAGGLVASVLDPGCVPHLLVSHRSAENHHWAMTHYLRREPALDLNMSGSDGAGALMGIDAIRLACALV